MPIGNLANFTSDWLRELIRVARPGGKLLLTTPNYDSTSLEFLEATALEVVARAQGFTRRGIHPFRGCIACTDLDITSSGWQCPVRA